MGSTTSDSPSVPPWLVLREFLWVFLGQFAVWLKPVPPQPAPSRLPAVLLVPGFLAGDWSMRAMARRLRMRGFRTFESGISANVGGTEAMATRIEALLVGLASTEGPVSLVGHSRGGTLARLVAGRRPELVASVVTLGAPLAAPAAAHRHVLRIAEFLAELHRRGRTNLMSQSCLSGSCAASVSQEMARPLPSTVPFTAIYSRSDGVVIWESSVLPDAEPVRVRAAHNQMGVDLTVLRLTVRALNDAAGTLDRAA